MKEKYFSINESGCSIRCKLYVEQPGQVRQIVLFGHGFGGHKDNRAAARFAAKLLGKHKDAAVITFDWPCHGDDGRKRLTLADCDLYITVLLDYVQRQYTTEDLCLYATSFGGYLFLKYIFEHGNPFRRIAMRCPAINMYEAISNRVLSDLDHEKLAKRKPVLAGFDRKIRIDREFMEELHEADITELDFIDYADALLILMGTKDEVISLEEVSAFADRNVIEFIPVQNADHRFSDPQIMDLAIHEIITFLTDK